MKIAKYLILAIIILIFISAPAFAGYCGNGIVEFPEECDNGADYNSDTAPDACRADCTLPTCGDFTRDSNEECDEGPLNSNQVPNQCRMDCRLPYCGDGVIDRVYGEECDDDADWCSNCMMCYEPRDNLHISESGKLCPGSYTIGDGGEEGVIIIDGSNIVLDCNGAALEGVASQMAQQEISQQATQLFGGVGSTGNADTAEFNGNPSSMILRSGTGIHITGNNVVLAGCDITNYRNGVKLSSSGSVLANNMLCDNTYGVNSDSYSNFGAKNYCDYALNWMENGATGCTYDCENNLNEETGCPICVCEDCPPCEEGEGPQQDEEPQQEEEGFLARIRGFFQGFFGGREEPGPQEEEPVEEEPNASQRPDDETEQEPQKPEEPVREQTQEEEKKEEGPTCGGMNDTCTVGVATAYSGCCSGYECVYGKCRPANEPCTESGKCGPGYAECCSGICRNYRCVSETTEETACREERQSCDDNNPCCQGYVCSDGICIKEVTDENCIGKGEFCGAGAAANCCEGYECIQGHCQ
jgi:hypothetical protein